MMTLRARSALALPAALAALVLLAALVSGAVFVATEEVRAGRTDLAEQRALAAAEWAMRRAIERWDPAWNLALEPLRSAAPETVTAVGGATVEVLATRVRPRGVWLTAHAVAGGDRAGGGPAARQDIGTSLRLVGPRFSRRAALTAGGAVVVAGGGIVDGRPVVPAEWDAQICGDSLGPSVAGVAAPDTARVCGESCIGGESPLIFGDPPERADAGALSAATYDVFGDEQRAQLAARAVIVLPGGAYAPRPLATGGRCDRAAPLNWGDPGRTTPCADYAPVIRVRGDLTMAPGAMGQGVLLVDGDLRLEAGARFTGVVVVGDDLTVSGPGAIVTGAAFARDVDGVDGSRIDAGGAVRFSACAAERAALAAARLAPTPVRWWVALR